MLFAEVWNEGRKKQPKQSAPCKQALFSFRSLSFFVTAEVVTRVPILDRKANCIKELDRFSLMWRPPKGVKLSI